MMDAEVLTRTNQWQLRTRTLHFAELPKLMGIVNVTPDSFSDGGQFYSRQLAVEQALRLEDTGADIIDIGGESTRPYSEPVSPEEELERVIPVIESLSDRLSVPISVDTSKAIVAEAAMAVGAEIINDVTGLEGDAGMLDVAVRTRAGVCAMHMRGTPQTMQDKPEYSNVVEDIFNYLAQRDRALLAAGIAPQRICLDPGIGFGKTHEHNWALVRACARFHQLGRPLLVGHSRKGFIGKLSFDRTGTLTAGSVGVALALARRGVQILRVHDVHATRDALRCFAAAGGLD